MAALERHLGSGLNRTHEQLHARQLTGDATYLIAWRDDVPVGHGLVRWAGLRDERARVAGAPEISNLGVPEALRGDDGIRHEITESGPVLLREL